MDYIKISKSMIECDPDQLRDLCLFLGMSEIQVEDELYYFVNGEGFNYKGYSFVGGVSDRKLYEGDYLLKTKEGYRLIPSEFSDLFVDHLAVDRLEFALITIRESGELSKAMNIVAEEGLGFNLLTEQEETTYE
ncbi:MAG: hypothetical protein GY861_26095 [bacterium]|nr:hypothetical protein [bacterium]